MTTHADYLEMIKKAAEAAKTYYDADKLLMSDDEYDALIEEIEFLSEENGWSEGDSLLTVVAAGVSSGGDVQHEVPMLSLAKANTLETVNQFLGTLKATVQIEPKFDGLAISAIYKNGQLVQVATRGDGVTGEDITDRAVNIKGLPHSISHTGKLEVRGEVFITSEDFDVANINRLRYSFAEWRKSVTSQNISPESLYSVAQKNRINPEQAQHVEGTRSNGSLVNFVPEKFMFANERNAIAGSLRNEERAFEVPMTFACYDVYGEGVSSLYSERLALVSELGITSANSFLPEEVRSLADPVSAINLFGEIRNSKQLGYPTDGVVIKAEDDAVRNRMGIGSKSPKWAIAYKYPSSHEESVLLDIEPNIGRTGRLTLRARISPVLVDGTLIEYVSLHNVSWVEEHDLRIGDTVLVRRANDVIPHIDAFVSGKRPADAQRWIAPETCPQCDSEWDKSTLLWRCASPSCGELNGIIFAVGRDYLDIDGMSEAILTRLNEDGLVRNIADIFKLAQEDFAGLFMGRYTKDGTPIRLGETVATKLYEQVQLAKSRPFAKVLAALGIRSLGRTFGRTLANRYGSISALLKASKDELAQIEGIGDKKASMIYDGLREKIEVIKELNNLGINLKNEVSASATESKIKGLKIVVSGNVPGYTRTTIQDKISQLGGTPSSSVSSSTNILVAGDDMTGNSKYQKAVQLGVKIIDPQDFLSLLS